MNVILGPHVMDALEFSFFESVRDYWAEDRMEMAASGGCRGVMTKFKRTHTTLRAAIFQAKNDKWLFEVASQLAEGGHARLLELLDKMDCPGSYNIWVSWLDFQYRLEVASGGCALPHCNGLVLLHEPMQLHTKQYLKAEKDIKDVADSMGHLEITPREKLTYSMEEFAAQLSEKLPSDLAPVSLNHNLKTQSYFVMRSSRRDEEIVRLREEVEMLKNKRESLPGSHAFVQAKVESRMSSLLGMDSAVKKCIAIRRRPLSQEQANEVKAKIFGSGPPGEILVRAFNVELSRQKLRCLKIGTWLDDEAVNIYMQLLKKRDDELCSKISTRRHSHFFNSFFIEKLIGEGTYNYRGVKRWTKKAKIHNIFDLERIFFPINISNLHWCMSVVHVQAKKIRYYDSMGGKGTTYLCALKQWLGDEHRTKLGCGWNDASWEMIPTTNDVPQQKNGNDCGVFSITVASFLSENLPLHFGQDDMDALRMKYAWEILNSKLLLDWDCNSNTTK